MVLSGRTLVKRDASLMGTRFETVFETRKTDIGADNFPYTAAYVRELLGMDENRLAQYVKSLNLTPRIDDKTGRQVFTHRDLETLKKAIEMGAPLTPSNTAQPKESAAAQSGALAPATRNAASALSSSSTTGGKDLAVLVETVSQVKEGILKDLGRLLDDKLSGLDEVVVELIRTKSENDSLKRRVAELERENGELQDEVESFVPVQFGFYRKAH